MLIASGAAVERLRLEPRARFVAFGLAGVDPTRTLHGNPQAMRRALDRAGLSLDEMAVIEVNEAFSPVVLQTVHDLQLSERMDDVNPNGGGISLGHPLGATGRASRRRSSTSSTGVTLATGIASMCVGFGMAIAGVVERV